MAPSTQATFPRHYIVVVHGIGEQRHNETTVEVVHRFAEARNAKSMNLAGLMPADLSSQSIREAGGGHSWSEFRGIPVDPHGNTGMFDGTRAARTAGRNFRFVDLYWADILQDHAKAFSSPPEQWAGARVKRMKEPFTGENWLPAWAMPLLREIDASIIPIKTLMKHISPELEDLVFNRVIGDIHLYGDYARTRGQAVRRFHWMLDEIYLRDYANWCRFERKTAEESYVPPVFTILAHSLGTVLSFDALVYAFATQDIRKGLIQPAAHSIPFPGYIDRDSCPEQDEEANWKSLIRNIRGEPRQKLLDGAKDWETLTARFPHVTVDPPSIPPLLWRHRVKHFISLGSPIDKYHVLWHHNYRHMGLHFYECKHSKDGKSLPGIDPKWADDWLDQSELKKLDQKILHYNLCDEQDPVGHHLDTASESKNYREIFQYDSKQVAIRDVVFRRYPVPGAAHVQYWKDHDLFTRLVKEVIDDSPKGTFLDKDFIEQPGVYETALVWAYFRIPFIAAVLTGILLSYGWISLWKNGFALSYISAIAAAVLLWLAPNPGYAYQQEMIATEQRNGQRVKIGFWERWKPRPSLFANLVRGMVAWRRILIWLNEKREYRVTKTRFFSLRVPVTIKGEQGDQYKGDYYDLRSAQEAGRRLSLKTEGMFLRKVWMRLAGGCAGLALSAFAALGLVQWLDPNKALIVGLAGVTISTCYLLTMLYVSYCFNHMKYRALLEYRPTDENTSQTIDAQS